MRKALRDVVRLIETARYCRQARRRNGGDIGVLNAYRICRRGKFEPSEAFYLGFFDPGFDERTLDCYVSRRELTKLQERVNPPSWVDLLKNKGMFYRFCMANEVPVPALYALYFQGNGAVVSDGRWLAAEDEAWGEYLDEELPETFVVKPARGSNGDGVVVFERCGEGFMDAARRPYNVGEVRRAMDAEVYRPGAIVQERLRNHAALDRLAGSGYLQTVRVCTFVDRAGEAHVLHAHLKLTPPGAAIDNFGVGLSGSLQCCIDLDSGVPQAAVRLRGCGHGLELVDRHPETGIAFGESPLPYWEEFWEVVKEAAKRFLPVRAIGWDVAITPKGPVVVEGNIWWGPNNPHRNMDKVREALRSDGVVTEVVQCL